MPFLSRAETQFLRRHLDAVCHVTLDPQGPGVLRIHLVPSRHRLLDVPFVAILNGRDLLPLRVSWAILLANFIEALRPYEGQTLTDADRDAAADAAVQATAAVYRSTPPEQIAADLQGMMATLFAVARGQTPPLAIQPIDLGDYAAHMAAPHRMDLLISAMVKDGAWHCNQKCLHCYAARQPYAEVEELDTDQWLAVIQKCRAAGVPQLTFTGGEPTLRHDLVKLVDAAQWFVTRLNTNGRMLTPVLCRELAEASLDSVQVTLYSADEATHNTLVGAEGFADTVAGIKNALAAGLNVSINTPLCSLNRDYAATLAFARELGVRYATCSGLIPAGGAQSHASRATRLTPEQLAAALRAALDLAAAREMEVDFTSPGWLSDETLRALGLTRLPRCGACLSNMAVAPDGTVLPCQSWLHGPALGNILHDPWRRIWNGRPCRTIRRRSARMRPGCPLGPTPIREEADP